MLSVAGKIYVGILVDRLRRVNGGLIGRDRVRRSDLHTKQIGEKAREKKTQNVCGYYRFGEAI